jgi:hypothetical protein
MKIILFIGFCLTSCLSIAQEHKDSTQIVLDKQKVELSCGQCQFGLEGDGCSLAVRIDGQSFFVDGSEIDDHGDAHAHDGFCSTIRQGIVSGTLIENRFQLTYIELIPFK